MSRDDLQLVALAVLAWWLLRKRPDVAEAIVEDLVPAPKATVAALASGGRKPQTGPPAPSPADLLPPPTTPDVLQPTADDFSGGGGGQSGGAGAGGEI